jgi:hypothetical protein
MANPRIVWGVGADGLLMGDLEEAVRAKLGEPDGPRFIDWYGTSHGLMWDEGPHAGVAVTFMWRPDHTRDVGLIELVPPCAGRTAGGVGIGSPRALVECLYGEPEVRSPDNSSVNYTHRGVLHLVHFEADTVAWIWMLDPTWLNREN